MSIKGKKTNEKGLVYMPYIISEISPLDFNNFDIEKFAKSYESKYSSGISISSRYKIIKIEIPINEIRKEKINSIKKTIK
jgi:hypothetical protein